MKRILLCGLLALAAITTVSPGVNAQEQTKQYPGIQIGIPAVNRMNGNSVADTINASSATDTVDQAKNLVGGWEGVSIQATAVRLSGTASGYAILQSSNDGKNYTNHFGTSADTLITLTGTAPQTKIVDIGLQTRAYYRIRWIAPSSTQSVAVQGTIRYWGK